jgi:hypothetical protein
MKISSRIINNSCDVYRVTTVAGQYGDPIQTNTLLHDDLACYVTALGGSKPVFAGKLQVIATHRLFFPEPSLVGNIRSDDKIYVRRWDQWYNILFVDPCSNFGHHWEVLLETIGRQIIDANHSSSSSLNSESSSESSSSSSFSSRSSLNSSSSSSSSLNSSSSSDSSESSSSSSSLNSSSSSQSTSSASSQSSGSSSSSSSDSSDSSSSSSSDSSQSTSSPSSRNSSSSSLNSSSSSSSST